MQMYDKFEGYVAYNSALVWVIMTFVIRALFGWLCLDTRHLQPRKKHIAIAEKSGEKRRAEFTKAQSDQCKLLVRFM